VRKEKKMIQTVDDAKEYRDKMVKGCEQLGNIAVEAGMNTHGAVFYALASAMIRIKPMEDWVAMAKNGWRR